LSFLGSIAFLLVRTGVCAARVRGL